jgi:hypothetical protein
MVAAWVLVGGLSTLSLVSVLTIGLFVLLITVLATVLLSRHQEARRGMLGLVRDGPGMICSAIEGGTACADEVSPWP